VLTEDECRENAAEPVVRTDDRVQLREIRQVHATAHVHHVKSVADQSRGVGMEAT